MIRRMLQILAPATIVAGLSSPAFAAPPATLILRHGEVWTVDPARPEAEDVAVRGKRIAAVGSDREIMKLKGAKTRVLDLKGAFVLPGLIDAHTHFGNAVESFFQVRLVDVDDQALLAERLKTAVHEVPKGMWITGYDWSSAAAVLAKRRGDKAWKPFQPNLAEIDAIAPDHPVLLRRFDGTYFVNSRGFDYAHIDRNTPDPPNGHYDKDANGDLTGMLLGTAGERMAEIMPPQSRARDLIGARAMLRELNAFGITGIHDIARVDEISQTRLFRTAVERSTTDLDLFKDLRARGELTVRVYPILTLASWSDYKAHGITPGAGDEMIRYGALKMFLDGFWMERPYDNNPSYSGGLSFRVVSEKQLHDDIVAADKLGFDPAAHVIGDKAHRLLADWYEDAIARNPPRDRRFRFIHAWYPSPREVERMGAMHAIADVTPYHLIRELDGMQTRLGARANFAFPWRTMIEHGVRIDIGSDWPGSYDRNNLAPLNPFENIYYATRRARLDGTPSGGWLPNQALTVDEAIRAYTINPAYASREERLKGSLTPGKLADIAVLDRNIRKLTPERIRDTKVRLTILGGRIVYEAEAER